MREKLFDWQNEIINKYKDRPRFGLFLDMGLGKTPISVGFAEEFNADKVLVITLNSKTQETINDEGSWAYWLNLAGFNITNKKADDYSSDKLSLIVNYESLFNRKDTNKLNDYLIKFIKECKNKRVVIILDESHKIKNHSSNQTKSINKIITQLNNTSNLKVYLLTGTPFTTGFIDLHNQLKILGLNMTKTEFIDNFCIRGHIPNLLDYQQPIVAYKNVKLLYELVHKYALTMKSDEVINLPEQIFKYFELPQSKEFELFTSEKLKGNIIDEELTKRKEEIMFNFTDSKKLNPFYRNIAYPDLKWMAETTGSFWLRARQLSIGFQGNNEESLWYNKQRFEKLEKFLKENESNYVLFYNYTPELYELYELCERLGYNIDVYSGEIKSLIFYNKYSQQNDAERLVNNKNIIISNFASGSTGMNWQLYNKCIIFSLPLYKDYEQALKRIHRIGQKETTLYYIFYQNNWLDQSMLDSLEQKIQYNENMFAKKLSETTSK